MGRGRSACPACGVEPVSCLSVGVSAYPPGGVEGSCRFLLTGSVAHGPPGASISTDPQGSENTQRARAQGSWEWEVGRKKRFSAQHLSTMAVDGPYKDNQSMKFRIDFIFHAHKQSSKKRNEMQNKHLMKYLQLTWEFIFLFHKAIYRSCIILIPIFSLSLSLIPLCAVVSPFRDVIWKFISSLGQRL